MFISRWFSQGEGVFTACSKGVDNRVGYRQAWVDWKVMNNCYEQLSTVLFCFFCCRKDGLNDAVSDVVLFQG